MIKEVLNYCGLHQMFAPGDRVIAALSGGADSVCLLSVLDKLKEELGIRLLAVHVHHGLRGAEADRDAKWAEEFCGKLGISFLLVYCDVKKYAGEQGMSLEEAGRTLRYAALEKEAKKHGAARIAVAHHGDDNAETILYNLFRGTGLKGLGGIAPVRGRIVRPLLCCSRKDILNYLEEEGLGYCQDSTNACNDYTRNKIRNRLIPLIVEEINHRAVENILRAGGLAARTDVYLGKQASELLRTWGKREPGRVGIPVLVLRDQDPLLGSYLIAEMVKEISGSGKDITAKHMEQALALAGKQVGRRLDLPHFLSARRDYEFLWIENGNGSLTGDQEGRQRLPAPVFTVFPYKKGVEIPRNEYTKWFDYDKIENTLSVRTRREGDYFTLRSGGKKTVKSYMIDRKIAREDRDKIPLLADGNHVVWMIGYRISEYYKVTDQTQMILQVQISGGNNNVG